MTSRSERGRAATGPSSICRLLEDAAERSGDRPAVITDGEVLRYEDLIARARAVARVLMDRVGDNPRVALLAENGPAYVVLYWGILLAGKVSVELNPGLGDPALSEELRNGDPDLLLAESTQAARMERLGLPVARKSVSVACLDEPSARAGDLARRLAEALEGRGGHGPDAFLARDRTDSLASIVPTSGTTGEVKGVCLTHSNLAFATRAIAESLGLSAQTDERFLGNLPLHYTYGKSVLHLATYLGAPIVFTRRVLSARNLFKTIETESVTHLSLVPYLCSLLFDIPRFRSDVLPRVRRITVAGGGLHPGGEAEMMGRFPGRYVPMYGLTEASTRVTCMPAGEAEGRPGSCGKPIPGVDVGILGADDSFLAPSERGEVVVRGANVMQGYFRDEARTEESFRGEWLRTGDLGFLDADGYLTITGRRKDMIKVMGESVAASSVEAVIAAIPGVAEVAVRGLPDLRTGEAIGAFVVRRQGAALDEESIRRHCSEALGPSRVPARVRFLESLPKTASGKVRKHLLDA